MRFIDAHNHLQDPIFNPKVFKELEQLGIEYAVVNSTHPDDWPAVARLADEHPWIIPNFGVHPWFLDNLASDWRARLESYLTLHPSGIGEIGLDRNCDRIANELQEFAFSAQLKIASERNLPVTIHCYKRWGEILSQLERVGVAERGFLVHSFNGPLEVASKIINLGGYLSFSGKYLTSSGDAGFALLRMVPRNRLLIESDAPNQPLPIGIEEYQLVSKRDDKRINHPGNIRAIYRAIAAGLEWDVEQLCAEIRENFLRLYTGVLRRKAEI